MDQATLEERQCMGLAMVEMLDRLAVHYTPEECVQWFRSPQPLIENKTPIDLIAEGRKKDLERIWDQIDSGAYI